MYQIEKCAKTGTPMGMLLALAIAATLTTGCDSLGKPTAAFTDNSSSAGDTSNQKICIPPAEKLITGAALESFREVGAYQTIYNSSSDAVFAFGFVIPVNSDTDFYTVSKGLIGTTITAGGPAGWDVSVSECPGDYDVASQCHANAVEVSHIKYSTNLDPNSRETRYTCSIQAGKKYYLNVRLSPGQTCTAGSCGFILNLPGPFRVN